MFRIFRSFRIFRGLFLKEPLKEPNVQKLTESLLCSESSVLSVYSVVDMFVAYGIDRKE